MSLESFENLDFLKTLPFSQKTLIFGIGNLGRQDDGLGILLVEKLEKDFLLNSTKNISKDKPKKLFFESNYQLNIEDALLISEYDLVFFIDATHEATLASNIDTVANLPFRIRELKPSDEVTFSTHAMSMSSVLGFCNELYGKNPKSFLITLPGFSWDISDEMSIQAKKYLESSFVILSSWIKTQYA